MGGVLLPALLPACSLRSVFFSGRWPGPVGSFRSTAPHHTAHLLLPNGCLFRVQTPGPLCSNQASNLGPYSTGVTSTHKDSTAAAGLR